MKSKSLSVIDNPAGTRRFDEVLRIIQAGRAQAFEAVNLVLMETYWAVGQHLHQQVAEAGWGKAVVKALADWLQVHAPDAKGFSSQNLWRMKQFYEVFSADEKLSALPRVLPQAATSVFKDSYLLDFLNLPQPHSEAELQTALLRNLRQFLLELGDGFAFVGEKVRLQVGQQDFELDLLFFHRDLQCLVAFELKTGRFEPAHMGQLNFYLEALDRDRKRPHENPSIGVLLCGSKDDEVVEYAMSRQLSPAMVAEYQTRMIAKGVLQQKLHEWSLMLRGPEGEA